MYGFGVDDGARGAWIQRCTYTETDGGVVWQCKQPDPHPSGEGHRWPPERRYRGKVLTQQSQEWLAGELVDRLVQIDHLQGRLDELTMVAAQLAQLAAFGTPLSTGARRWLAANAPSAAAKIGVLS
jgi:hypothetical protein